MIAEARLVANHLNTPKDDENDSDEHAGEEAQVQRRPPDMTDSSSYAPPVIPYAPPTLPPSYVPPPATMVSSHDRIEDMRPSNHAPKEAAPPPPASSLYPSPIPTNRDTSHVHQRIKTRDRVLSDEGKRLFVAATQSLTSRNTPIIESSTASGFSFIASGASSTATSAFGFISKDLSQSPNVCETHHEEGKDDTVGERGISGERNNMYTLEIPPNFLAELSSIDPMDFENLWQTTTDSSEEWTVEIVPDFDLTWLESCLSVLKIQMLASGKINGVHKCYFHGEQVRMMRRAIHTCTNL